jgi:hypothetical protein
MKITEASLNVGTLLGGIDQIKENLQDAGFDPENITIEIRLPATNEQMMEIGTILRRTEKFLGIIAGPGPNDIRLYDDLAGYIITNEKESID